MNFRIADTFMDSLAMLPELSRVFAVSLAQWTARLNTHPVPQDRAPLAPR